MTYPPPYPVPQAPHPPDYQGYSVSPQLASWLGGSIPPDTWEQQPSRKAVQFTGFTYSLDCVTNELTVEENLEAAPDLEAPRSIVLRADDVRELLAALKALGHPASPSSVQYG